MASNPGVLAENNLEPLCAEQLNALADERDALIDRQVEYRTLIDEQKEMIRCMFEFARVLEDNARETMARADRILDRKIGLLPASDRANRPHPPTPPRYRPVYRAGSKNPLYPPAAAAPLRRGSNPGCSPHKHVPAAAGPDDRNAELERIRRVTAGSSGVRPRAF